MRLASIRWFGRIVHVGKLLQKKVKLCLYCARTRSREAMGSVLEELPRQLRIFETGDRDGPGDDVLKYKCGSEGGGN